MITNTIKIDCYRNASRRFFLLIIAVFICFAFGASNYSFATDTPEAQPDYIWPTNASRSLSSSFGETRDGHFHFGIDIKTNHAEGYPCYAVDDGEVVRARVSPYGYGKALYLRLKDGRMAVYAHLQRFSPRVEEYIRDKQYQNHQFRCQIYFDPGELPFKKGETVAWTGSTGIGVPHLHFEIREDDGYRNAMNYGFEITDTCPPIPRKLALIPLDVEAEVNHDFYPAIYNLPPDEQNGHNRYRLENIPSIYGRVGLAISGYDNTDAASNRISFYGMDLYLEDSLIFSAKYDAIGYEETKQIYLERNYRLMRSGKGSFHHLFTDPNVTVDFFRAGDGILDSRQIPPGVHDFEIVLWDFNGNSSHVTGKIASAEKPVYRPALEGPDPNSFFKEQLDTTLTPCLSSDVGELLKTDFFDDFIVIDLPVSDEQENVLITLIKPYHLRIPIIEQNRRWKGKLPLNPKASTPWEIEIRVENRDGSVHADTVSWNIQPVTERGGSALSDDRLFRADFEQGALYEPIFIRISSEESTAEDNLSSRIYHINPYDVPIKGKAGISFIIPADEPKPEKLGIYTLSKKGKWKFVDNDLHKIPGSVFGEIPSLETCVLIKDEEPPELRWLAPNFSTSNPQPVFRLSVADELSGVDDRTLDFRIDDEWMLMEYDYEEDRIFGTPRQPLAPGKHLILFSVKDYNGNEVKLERSLQVTTK